MTDSQIAAFVASANRLFEAHGVGFDVGERVLLDDAHLRLETRADRHALGAFLDRARIDVFFVDSLRDVDDPPRLRRGVHWRPARRPGAHFVIVTRDSPPDVLAHELGHYFGNPHSHTPGNIMSYDRGQAPPFFDEAQSRTIARFAATFRRIRSPVAH